MDQYDTDYPQPNPATPRSNLHSTAAFSVSEYQPAHLSRNRHPRSSGCPGMAGKSGKSLRHHHVISTHNGEGRESVFMKHNGSVSAWPALSILTETLPHDQNSLFSIYYRWPLAYSLWESLQPRCQRNCTKEYALQRWWTHISFWEEVGALHIQ